MKRTALWTAMAIVMGASQSAWADYWDWVGKGDGETSYFDEYGDGKARGTFGCWYHSAATTTDKFAESNHNFENSGASPRPSFNSGWDKKVTFRATTSMVGAVNVSYSDAPIVFQSEDPSYGISSSGNLFLLNNSTLQINSGTYSFGYLVVGQTSGKTATLIINGGTVKATGSYSRIGLSGGTGILTVKAGGSYDNTGASNVNLTLGQENGSSGTLNVEGGEVTVKGYIALNYNAEAKTSVVNVTDGGVLACNKMYMNHSGQGGTVNIDGGTLKACGNNNSFLPADNGLNVYVGANGVTIDSDGHDITIGASLQDKSGDAGVVRFAGNGVITLNGTPSYTGGTTNVAGTVLSLTAAAKTALVAYPIVVEIPPEGAADGRSVFEINDGNGTFTQAEVDAMVVTGTNVSRYRLALADNGAKVVVADTLAGEYAWNDGASGASWRATGKWSKNGVAGNWYDSTAAVFANADDKATVDSAVTAATVTFRANATVDGSAMLTVPVIAVSNGVSATINAHLAGTIEKIGTGTLTLSQSRTEQTGVTEGTLVVSGAGTTVPWDDVLLGTEAGKTVVLKFENGATLASVNWNISLGHDANGPVGGGVTVELHKDGGDWYVPNMFTAGWNDGDVGRFYHNDGSLTVGGQCRVSSQAGSSGEFTMNGGTVTVSNNLYVGCNYNVAKGVFNMNGGSFTCIGTTYVSFSKNDDPAELHINGGTFTSSGTFIAGNDNNASVAMIDLNAVGDSHGVLETKGLTLGKGSATLTFNGGELKAVGNVESSGLIKSGITVRVGANGGIVNANGKAVTIPATIGAAGDTGGMTYKGGGTVTLSVQPAYSGMTTVELGTALVVPSAIAGANLEVTVPAGLPAGIYKIAAVSGNGVFASDILSTATLPSGLNAHFFFENGGKEIWCIYSNNAGDHIWIGGPEGSLNDGANWLSGNVPVSGTAVIASVSAAALTNPEGGGFAATTLVFPTGSASVAISGAQLSRMEKITNSSSNEVEFENAVSFSGNVDVVQAPGPVKFTGGATGTWLERATTMHGTYNFTGSGDRIEHGGTTVKSDGVYNLPNATFYKHNADFHMEADGRAVVKDAKIASTESEKRLMGTFNGEFKVNGEFYVSGSGGNNPTHYVCSSGNGTFIANKLRVVQNACIVPSAKTIMGPDGIIRGAGYVRVYNSGSHEFGSYADWTMYHNNLGNTTTGDCVIFKRSSSDKWSNITFDTTDYYDKTIGRTITSEAPIGAADTASAEKFRVAVKGVGKFVFANTSDGTIFSGGLTVTDSATVEVMPNAWPGKGPVTLNDTSTFLMHTGGDARTGAIMVNDGATLKVAETGTATLGGELRLNDGATLAFNFTEKNAAPRLVAPSVTFGDSANVRVAVSRGDRMVARGSYTIVEGLGNDVTSDRFQFAGEKPKWVGSMCVEDGKLVLNTIGAGFTFILK